ncbi:MAG: transcriptional activator NhaR [Candidatus Eisenbacteria bacterium]
MDWINYHHLLYFWMVAREGTVAKAAERLHLSQPTISGQIKTLEESIGGRLFERSGRGLVLTELGQLVFRYADEIFHLGRELTDAIAGRAPGHALGLRVGVVDVMPKLIVQKLLEPITKLEEPVRIACFEGKAHQLLGQLAIHELDVVLSDGPIPSDVNVRAFSHLLGECGVTFLAAPRLAKKYRPRFPESLADAPLLLPTANTMLRRSVDAWFEILGIRPDIVGEFEDSALLKVFGQKGQGVFLAATAIEATVKQQYGVHVVGRTEEVRERFYAISVERRVKHPAVVAIAESARRDIFGVSAA